MTTTIERAVKHGATFQQRPEGDWLAICKKRGRAMPLVQLQAPTQDEAAAMYLAYFHIKE